MNVYVIKTEDGRFIGVCKDKTTALECLEATFPGKTVEEFHEEGIQTIVTAESGERYIVEPHVVMDHPDVLSL